MAEVSEHSTFRHLKHPVQSILNLLRRAISGRPAMQRPDVPTVRFTAYDGRERELDGVQCSTCKNYFWVELAEIELPSFCPYCGIKFLSTRHVDNDEWNAAT